MHLISQHHVGMRCVRGPVLKTPPLQRREREFDHRLGSKGAALAAQIKESACSAGDLGSIPGLGRSPWRREWLPTSVFLPGKVNGQRSLVYYSPWGHKESDITEWLTHWGNKIPHAVWYSQKIKSKKKKLSTREACYHVSTQGFYLEVGHVYTIFLARTRIQNAQKESSCSA